jgi:hypothetical protein
VLGVGLLGGFGRIIEKHCRASIAALEYFAQTDAHAVQYSLIAKSLLTTALEYLEKKEILERQRRTESSSKLFGLVPRIARPISSGHREQAASGTRQGESSDVSSRPEKSRLGHADSQTPRLGFDFESGFLGLSETVTGTPDFLFMDGPLDADAEQTFGTLNLFPLLDTDGHIDLANYF